MSRHLALVLALLWLWNTSDAGPLGRAVSNEALPGHFPQTVRVRLWYLHPPQELRIGAAPGTAWFRSCQGCRDAAVEKLTLHAIGTGIHNGSDRATLSHVRVSGIYQMTAAGAPAFRADFPVEIQASEGRLLATALMPMEEYVASVLAGEVGSFHSDEALKAMAVAARTFAMHFASRHALEGFEFCDTTHCQDVRIAGIDPHFRRIADSTAGELLWYDGEPAATYYHANCGGTTEDGRYVLGNNEPRAPFLIQHSDEYCVRNGGAQWRSEVSKRELQRALAQDGITIPGQIRSVSVLHRTSSGRVEFLTVSGSARITVPALPFRAAVGRHIGWERLKSNWYDVSDSGDYIAFHGRGSGHGVGLCQVGAESMGEEGHSYREILAFYYPGTHLGVAAQGIQWQRLANEDLELLTTRPDRDRPMLALGTRFMHEAEESTGLLYRSMPRLKIYPTVTAYRDSTGEPGWIAASTRGSTIQMQPPENLRATGALESTVHHELLHLLLESYSHPGTPLWFREGLVIYLTDPRSPVVSHVALFDTLAGLEKALRAPADEEELRRAYSEARQRVSRLADANGKQTLLKWLQDGIPTELALDRLDQRSTRR